MIRKIRWALQRMNRGYSDRDVWSFEAYLSEVIAGGCERLRKSTHSYPPGTSLPEWIMILAQIEYGFRSYSNAVTNEADLTKEQIEKAISDLKKSGDLLIKWFPDLWD